MPMPQVADRAREAPAIVLRAVFAGIGRLLLAADKVRSRVMEQGAHEPPAGPAHPAPPPGPQAPRRPFEETGNVRVLREEEPAVSPGAGAAETVGGAPAAGPAAEPTAPEPAVAESPAPPEVAEPAPEAAQPAPAAPAPEAAEPERAALRPAAEPSAVEAAAEPTAVESAPTAAAVPPAPEATPVEPAPSRPTPAESALPIANYDELSLASLRARLRVLDAPTLRTLIDYERAHAGREAIISMFERRLAKVEGTVG